MKCCIICDIPALASLVIERRWRRPFQSDICNNGWTEPTLSADHFGQERRREPLPDRRISFSACFGDCVVSHRSSASGVAGCSALAGRLRLALGTFNRNASAHQMVARRLQEAFLLGGTGTGSSLSLVTRSGHRRLAYFPLLQGLR